MPEQLVVNRSFPQVEIPGVSVRADVIEDTPLFGVSRENVIVDMCVSRGDSCRMHHFQMPTANGVPVDETRDWDALKDWMLKKLEDDDA